MNRDGQGRKQKKWTRALRIALAALGVICLAFLAAGFFIAGYTTGNRPQTLEQARAWQEERYDLGFYDAAEKEFYTVAAEDGYVLHAVLLSEPSAADGQYVILSHGYTDNRFGAMKYARIWLDRGFKVIAYDLRGHGENEPARCTYSAWESGDLLALIEDARARFSDLQTLGLHGESLGAATSVAVLGYRPDVDFVVADCGFAAIADVLSNGMKSVGVPPLLLWSASLFLKLRFGYSYADMRPVDRLEGNTVPILFVHGAEDAFILPEQSERMRAATAGYAELHLIPGAGHALSVLTDPEGYASIVDTFLRRIGVLPEGA